MSYLPGLRLWFTVPAHRNGWDLPTNLGKRCSGPRRTNGIHLGFHISWTWLCSLQNGSSRRREAGSSNNESEPLNKSCLTTQVITDLFGGARVNLCVLCHCQQQKGNTSQIYILKENQEQRLHGWWLGFSESYNKLSWTQRTWKLNLHWQSKRTVVSSIRDFVWKTPILCWSYVLLWKAKKCVSNGEGDQTLAVEEKCWIKIWNLNFIDCLEWFCVKDTNPMFKPCCALEGKRSAMGRGTWQMDKEQDALMVFGCEYMNHAVVLLSITTLKKQQTFDRLWKWKTE